MFKATARQSDFYLTKLFRYNTEIALRFLYLMTSHLFDCLPSVSLT